MYHNVPAGLLLAAVLVDAVVEGAPLAQRANPAGVPPAAPAHAAPPDRPLAQLDDQTQTGGGQDGGRLLDLLLFVSLALPPFSLVLNSNGKSRSYESIDTISLR